MTVLGQGECEEKEEENWKTMMSLEEAEAQTSRSRNIVAALATCPTVSETVAATIGGQSASEVAGGKRIVRAAAAEACPADVRAAAAETMTAGTTGVGMSGVAAPRSVNLGKTAGCEYWARGRRLERPTFVLMSTRLASSSFSSVNCLTLTSDRVARSLFVFSLAYSVSDSDD